MKAPSTLTRMLAERAAQLACLLALGLLATGLVAWWNASRAPTDGPAAFLVSLTNPPPVMRTPDFSAQQTALAAGTEPVRAVLTGPHDLFAPTRTATVPRGDSR